MYLHRGALSERWRENKLCIRIPWICKHKICIKLRIYHLPRKIEICTKNRRKLIQILIRPVKCRIVELKLEIEQRIGNRQINIAFGSLKHLSFIIFLDRDGGMDLVLCETMDRRGNNCNQYIYQSLFHLLTHLKISFYPTFQASYQPVHICHQYQMLAYSHF